MNGWARASVRKPQALEQADELSASDIPRDVLEGCRKVQKWLQVLDEFGGIRQVGC